MPDDCDSLADDHLPVGVEDLAPGQSLPGGFETVVRSRLLARVPGVDGGLADAGLSQVPGLRQGADVAQRPSVEWPVSAEGRAAAHIHGPGRADAAGGVEDAAPAWPLSRCAHDDVVGQSVKKRVVDLPGL